VKVDEWVMVQEDDVRTALQWVIDPELGINIVDLGLVYGVTVQNDDVQVDLTMTTPACPLSTYLTANAEHVIRALVPGVQELAINLVWEPPWNPSLISESARRELGWEHESN
jgi:metal-sulfur cluster biosynthetic enzyme